MSAQATLDFVEGYLSEDEPLLMARRNAADVGGAPPVSPATGAALRFAAAALSARSVVEIGTGCGTSGVWLLRGMRSDGVLTSVDVDPEHQRLARKPVPSPDRKPVRNPAARKPDSIMADVDPFPLVPATCTMRGSLSGCPSASRTVVMRSRPYFAVLTSLPSE